MHGNFAVIVGSHKYDFEVRRKGKALVFQLNSDGQWEQNQKLLPPGGYYGDNFGQTNDMSVAIHGDHIVVGSPNDDNSSGSAHVFVRSNGEWTHHQKITQPGGAVRNDRFGIYVAIHGDHMVVSSSRSLDYMSSDYMSSVHVFVQKNGEWIHQQKLLRPTDGDKAASDWAGASIAIHDNHIVVGDRESTPHVFVQTDGTWVHQQNLPIGDGWFAIHGHHIVVGRDDEYSVTRSRSVHVFALDNNSWEYQAELRAPSDTGHGFGATLDIDEDCIILGASKEAHIFARDGSSWSHQGKLLQPGGATYDWEQFGWDVAVYGQNFLVASRYRVAAFSTE